VSPCCSPRLERGYRVGPETSGAARVRMIVDPAESVALSVPPEWGNRPSCTSWAGSIDDERAGLLPGEDLYARSESALAKLRRTESRSSFSSTTCWAR